jgi:hypothetical protein
VQERHRERAERAASYLIAPVQRVATASGLRRFVVLAPGGRVGSELLMSLLGSHPAVQADGELLHRPRLNARAYVDGRAALTRLRGRRAHGWKVVSNQLRYFEPLGDPRHWLQEWLARDRLIVVLRRVDLLRQAVSFLAISGSDREWHVRGDGAGPGPLTLDPVDFLAWLVAVEKAQDWLDVTVDGLDHLGLTYEADLLDPAQHQVTADRVFTALGLESAPVTTDLRKSVTDDLRAAVRNWDEVIDFIGRTRFAALLERPAPGRPAP